MKQGGGEGEPLWRESLVRQIVYLSSERKKSLKKNRWFEPILKSVEIIYNFGIERNLNWKKNKKSDTSRSLIILPFVRIIAARWWQSLQQGQIGKEFHFIRGPSLGQIALSLNNITVTSLAFSNNSEKQR